jgi:3-dehydroquinate dehydratase/shikimate dehydrogenase
MICVPLVSSSREELEQDLHEAARAADVVEFRLDYLAGARPRELLPLSRLPAIFTCRRRSDGGRWEGRESDRLALLQEAVDAGAPYVDVEVDAAAGLRRRPPTRTIISCHNFEETPEDLEDVYARVASLNPDVAKVVTTARDILDNLRLFRLLERASLPTIAFAMGERGLVSRVLTPKFGGYLTFASLRRGAESAPGQPTAEELHSLYRYRQISARTAVFGVIGNPIGHSLSPHIHNAAFRQAGLDAVYLPFLVDDVVKFVQGFTAIPVAGYSVTLPHKVAVMSALDEVEPMAREIGAVNTVVSRDGRLFGSNTDCAAAVGALVSALGGRRGDRSPLAGKSVVLLGAGGAARALAYGLRREGALLTILNRTAAKAEELARPLGAEWGGLEGLAQSPCDVLINTTSVGMHPCVDESVVPPAALRPGMVVFEAVYNPMKTRLLREAEAAGCLTVSGVDWFVEQAALQFETWTGRSAPCRLMRDIVVATLAEREAERSRTSGAT